MAKTINILGDTQAEQWKSVVHVLRACGGNMDYKGRDALCSELDRYIEWAEKTIAELNAENEALEKAQEKEHRIVKAVFGELVYKSSKELSALHIGSITLEEMHKLYSKLRHEPYCKRHGIKYEDMTDADFEAEADEEIAQRERELAELDDDESSILILF